MLIHWIWYATLPKLSLAQKHILLERYSDPEEIFHTEHYGDIPEKFVNALDNKELCWAQGVIKTCAEKHISILTFGDEAYPDNLRNIPDPPLVLYYKGVLPDFDGQPVIGVVGTRKASAYGLNNARQMSRQIAACGGLVVSGGADGIDAMALEGAMDVGKHTVAVLGCGVDIVYPRTSRKLFQRIEENGCLLSEYLPGTEPRTWQFPERNRIISGLSHGVLVVEAPKRSGALITAQVAFEQGREVFAVPGNIDVPTHAGSNALLQDYATAALSGWDVLKDYASRYPGVVEKREALPQKAYDYRHNTLQLKVAQGGQTPSLILDTDKKDIDKQKNNAYIDLDTAFCGLNSEERQIVACLDGTPRPVDTVIEQAGLPAARVLSVLTRLALKRVVINHPGGLVSVKK